jgi:hypothetical protein
MNNKYGLSAVMSNPDSLFIIALSLRSFSLRTRALVLEILGAVCLIPGGHRRILECMNKFRETFCERARFETAVACVASDMLFKTGYIANSRISIDEKFERVMDLQVSVNMVIHLIVTIQRGDRSHQCHLLTL